MTSLPSSSSLSARAWLTGDSQHLKWGGGVLYHPSSGRISLVFGRNPSHSDESFVPYMWYDPPCTATRPISFASDHFICLQTKQNQTKPSQAIRGCIIRSFPCRRLTTTRVITSARYSETRKQIIVERETIGIQME